MTYNLIKKDNNLYDIVDEQGNIFSNTISIAGEIINTIVYQNRTIEDIVDISKMFNLEINNLEEEKDSLLAKYDEIYRLSGPLRTNNINFYITLDNKHNSRVFCVYIENLYDFKTKENNTEIGCDTDPVNLIKLYKKIYNDILLNNIDEEKFLDNISYLNSIRVWYKCDYEKLHKDDNLLVYHLYQEIYKLLYNFCKETGLYLFIDCGYGNTQVKIDYDKKSE